jgi:uncharacterized RDD family membrane protein YckC
MESNAAQPAITAAENVTGPRIVAGIIDVVVLAIVFIIFSAVMGDSEADSSSFSFNLPTVPALLYFLVAMAYYVVPEVQMGGQTLGKKVMGLKVVTENGVEYSWGKAIIRNLLRIIDGLPFLYLLGVILIAVSKKHQRIGDMAAGTLVVKA